MVVLLTYSFKMVSSCLNAFEIERQNEICIIK